MAEPFPSLGARERADMLRPVAAADRYGIHVGDDGETIRFACPSAVEYPGDHVPSEVLQESGGRNVIDPNERHVTIPDMAALTPDFDYPAATVTVLSPARTIWKKATLIHVVCHRRTSRTVPNGSPGAGSSWHASPPTISAGPRSSAARLREPFSHEAGQQE